MSGISLTDDRDVLMQMDDALRPASRAGAVKPEGHVVTMDAGRRRLPAVRRNQFGHRMRLRRRAVGRDDYDLFVVTVKRLRQFINMGGFSDNNAGATVFDKEAVVGHFVQRIDRDRNRADAHRAEELDWKRRSIAEYEQDSIFTRGAERP